MTERNGLTFSYYHHFYAIELFSLSLYGDIKTLRCLDIFLRPRTIAMTSCFMSTWLLGMYNDQLFPALLYISTLWSDSAKGKNPTQLEFDLNGCWCLRSRLRIAVHVMFILSKALFNHLFLSFSFSYPLVWKFSSFSFLFISLPVINVMKCPRI